MFFSAAPLMASEAGVGGTGVGSPSCAPMGTGKAVCVIMGINNKLTSVVGP